MTDRQNFVDDMKQYFGMDEHAKQFCNLIFSNESYTEGTNTIDTIDTIDTIKKEPLYQLMLRKNYIDMKTGDEPMDIHPDFIDMIIRLAQFHRQIDTPASSDTFVEELIKMFDEKLNLYLDLETNLNAIIEHINLNSSKREFQNKIITIDEKDFTKNPELLSMIIFIKSLIKPSLEIENKIKENDPTLIVSYNTAIDTGIGKFIKNIFSNINILQSYTIGESRKYIKNIISNNLRYSFNIDFIKKIRPNTFTTLSTNAADNLVSHVYLGWDNLSLEAQKFYSVHLSLRTFNSINNRWDEVYPSTDLLNRILSSKASFRVNLARNPNRNTILFSDILPFIPLDVKGFSYRDDSDNIKRVNLLQIPESQRIQILKYIYDYVYRTGDLFELTVDGTNVIFKVKPYDPKNPALLEEFKLNYTTFTKNLVSERDSYYKNSKKSPKSVSSKTSDLEDNIYIDMGSNLRYFRDDMGLFNLVDSTRVDYATKLDTDIAEQKCYGTNLNDHKGSCNDIVQCMINTKPENMVRCLSRFSRSNLTEVFNISERDISRTNPLIILRILENFGFEIKRERNRMYLPPSYSEWKSYQNKKLVKLVDSNDKLRTYIQSLVKIVRTNPILVEKNYNQINKILNDKRGLHIFNSPHPPMLSSQSPTLFLPQPYFPIMTVPIGVLRGGNCTKNQAIFDNGLRMKSHFEMIFNRMEENGTKLIDTDKELIMNNIDRMIKLEQKLPRIMEDLDIFSKVIQLEKLSQKTLTPTSTPTPRKDISLQEATNLVSDKENLKGLYARLQNTFTMGLNSYYETFNNLYYVVQPPLLSYIR